MRITNAGYIQLGSDAPNIKMKKLTGTTNAAEGGTASLSHGLTLSKIISVTCQVINTAGVWLPPAHTSNPGNQYDFTIDTTTINIYNHATNSENILSKPIVITIFFEE
jgi:hypothetical protein